MAKKLMIGFNPFKDVCTVSYVCSDCNKHINPDDDMCKNCGELLDEEIVIDGWKIIFNDGGRILYENDNGTYLLNNYGKREWLTTKEQAMEILGGGEGTSVSYCSH